jgi:hypothetical protein
MKKQKKRKKTNNFLVWKMENVLWSSAKKKKNPTTNWNSLFGIFNIIYCEFERAMNKRFRINFIEITKKKLFLFQAKLFPAGRWLGTLSGLWSGRKVLRFHKCFIRSTIRKWQSEKATLWPPDVQWWAEITIKIKRLFSSS